MHYLKFYQTKNTFQSKQSFIYINTLQRLYQSNEVKTEYIKLFKITRINQNNICSRLAKY